MSLFGTMVGGENKISVQTALKRQNLLCYGHHPALLIFRDQRQQLISCAGKEAFAERKSRTPIACNPCVMVLGRFTRDADAFATSQGGPRHSRITPLALGSFLSTGLARLGHSLFPRSQQRLLDQTPRKVLEHHKGGVRFSSTSGVCQTLQCFGQKTIGKVGRRHGVFCQLDTHVAFRERLETTKVTRTNLIFVHTNRKMSNSRIETQPLDNDPHQLFIVSIRTETNTRQCLVQGQTAQNAFPSRFGNGKVSLIDNEGGKRLVVFQSCKDIQNGSFLETQITCNVEFF
mmetsp:Transcript_6743/g.14098  ORF Transcript_6743/g.14098 Transcript_6743/m.14098 type:complete len:288 (-) Transcript_6743:846-1709(-)